MTNNRYNYIGMLKAILKHRSHKNPNYSLRAFARDLEWAPSRLSEIINGKKGLSDRAAQVLVVKLGLNEQDKNIFLLSVKSQHSRNISERKKAKQELEQIVFSKRSKNIVKDSELKEVYNWYHLAILELLELEKCEHTIDWFAKSLKIKKSVAISALENLEKIGWLILENNKYRAIFDESTTHFDISSDSIKKYHEDMLKKAEESLYTAPVEKREFLNMTMSFNQSDLISAKKSIRDFQNEFAKKYCSNELPKDSIYQLSMQFFQLDQADQNTINQSEN